MRKIAEENYYTILNGHYHRVFNVTIFEPMVDPEDDQVWNCHVEFQSSNGSFHNRNMGASSLQALSLAAANAIMLEVSFLKNMPPDKKIFYGLRQVEFLDEPAKSALADSTLARLDLLETSLADLLTSLRAWRAKTD